MTGNDQATEPTAITPKQDALIAALLSSLSIVAAAQVAGVSEKTARRWLKLPEFQAGYKSAQKVIFNQALTGLMQKVDKAIETLDRNMSGEEVPASVQVRAAQIVLEQAINIHKLSEVEQGLKELEQLLQAQGTR